MNVIVLDLKKPAHQVEITEDSEILALFEGRGDDTIKTKVDIIHRKPNLQSRVNIKAVVFDQANFDLEAKMVIERGAYLTDSYLKVDALIMDESAKARAVPSLEISEDNVKGGHGATVGQVNQDQLHYLRTRGLSETEAGKVIVEAFLEDIKERIAAAK